MPDRGASSSPAETVAVLLDELQGTQDRMARMEALLAQVIPDYHRRLDSPVQPVPADEPSQDYEGNPGEDDEPEQDEPGIPEEDAAGYSADGDGEFEEPVRRRSHRENTPRAEDTGENQRAAPPRGAENHTPRLSRSERRRAREPTREPDIPSEDEDDEPGPYCWGGPVDRPHRCSGWEELYRPAFTVPADHRRVSIATQRELPPHMGGTRSQPMAPGTPYPRRDATAAPPKPRMPSVPLFGGQTPGQASSRTPAVAPPVVTRNPATPRAAGYPIGAVPTDSISRWVITALQNNASVDPDTVRHVGKMGIKFDPPAKYDGGTELKTFEQWVLGLLRWFRLTKLLGPGFDNTRVDVIGNSCEGAAKDWFQHEVEASDRGPEGWTTLEVIQGLQRRFITQRSAARAAQEFETLEQGSLDVTELHQQLRVLALQLPFEPDPYTFAKRFMQALDPRIANRVMALGYAPEACDIEMLVTVASDQQMAMQTQRHYQDLRGSTKSTTKPGKGKETNRSREATGAAVNIDVKAGAPRAPRPQATRANGGEKGRDGPRCFRCRKLGHIAADCSEPPHVNGKAAELVPEEDESPDELEVPAARIVFDDAGSVTGTNIPEGEGHESNPEEAIWNDFDETFAPGYACSIVYLDNRIQAHAGRPAAPAEAEPVHNPATRRRPDKEQPVRNAEEQQPITGYYRLGGALAHVMFDSGCGTDMVSPEFVRATRLTPTKLEQPIGLQMALIGSRGRINFGLHAELEVGPFKRSHYFDIANIEKYDVILGTPFLKQAGAKLDFARCCVEIGNVALPSKHRADTPQNSKKGVRSNQAEPAHSRANE
ncbi:hypothetical protein FRC08_016757 [Ceratobasidium sp. 394]|nr:hypothetical protein FRC08_016757 [Ceratobasidium sp. 394]